MKKKIDYDNLQEADVIVDYIMKRKSKGLYSLILTTGLPGTGKSSIDLRLAELTSKALTGSVNITEENIIDNVLDLIKFLRRANEKQVNIAIIEEISVLFPSRRAMSHDNVVVGKLLDTARKKEVILFANAPIFPSIDSHMRALGNIYIETLRINRSEKVVVAKALRMQTNPGSGKTYFHWLKRKGKEVHRIFVRKPEAETWRKYEDRKDKFLDELYADLKVKTEKKLGRSNIKQENANLLSPREIQVYDLVVKQGMTHTMAAMKLKISQPMVTRYFKNVKNKLKLESAPSYDKNNSKTNQNESITTQTAAPLAPITV